MQADKDARVDASGDVAAVSTTRLPYAKWRCIALAATVTGASFSNTLSVQSVVIILPTIGRDLGVPDSRQQWIVSAYSLTFGCFLLLWGRIGDVFDKKTIFVAGSAWVTVMTAINPFVRNEIAFNLIRGLQGLGAAANVPTALGIIGTIFPPGKAKNYAFAAYGAGAPLGSVFGNLIAGLVTSHLEWRWVFGIIAMLVGTVTAAGVLFIPTDKLQQTNLVRTGVSTRTALTSIDWIGALLITSGLVGLLFALTEGNVVGWQTPWVGTIAGLSLLLVAAFAAWQWWLERSIISDGSDSSDSSDSPDSTSSCRYRPPPLVRLSVFSASPRFTAALVVMALFYSGFNGFLVYATYFYQDYQGLSALQTTLRFLPTGIGGVLTCLCVARLMGRASTWLLLLVGTASVAAGCLLMAVPIPPTTSYFAYGLEAMTLSVIGADTAWPSLCLFVSQALPPADQAVGGALVNAAGQIGRAIALAVATAVQTAVMAAARGRSIANAGSMTVDDSATLNGIRAACWFNFGLSIAAVLLVLVAFRRSDIDVSEVSSEATPSAEAGLLRPSTQASDAPTASTTLDEKHRCDVVSIV